jgi:beta-lactam-binding protein with PASTA domain
VILDLRRLPDGPFGDRFARIADCPPAPAPVTVPDLRLLQRSSVERHLAEVGLRVRFRGAGPRVVAHDPPAGQATERGTSVTAWLSLPEDSSARRLPDLTGLSLRDALRRLGRLEVRVRIEGTGVVARQSPPAGTPLPLVSDCRLWCEPGMTSMALAPRPAEATMAAAAHREAFRNAEP